MPSVLHFWNFMFTFFIRSYAACIIEIQTNEKEKKQLHLFTETIRNSDWIGASTCCLHTLSYTHTALKKLHNVIGISLLMLLFCILPSFFNQSVSPIWYRLRVCVLAGCFCLLHRFACSSIVVNMVFLMFFSLFFFISLFSFSVGVVCLSLWCGCALDCIQYLMDKIGFNGRMHCTRAFWNELCSALFITWDLKACSTLNLLVFFPLFWIKIVVSALHLVFCSCRCRSYVATVIEYDCAQMTIDQTIICFIQSSSTHTHTRHNYWHNAIQKTTQDEEWILCNKTETQTKTKLSQPIDHLSYSNRQLEAVSGCFTV